MFPKKLPIIVLALFGLLITACENTDKTEYDGKKIKGQIMHAQLSDSILLVYSVESKKDIVLRSGSNNNWDDVHYEVGCLTGLRVAAADAKVAYQLETPCAKKTCGTHYIDKILAVGKQYLALDCHCTGGFVVVSVADGKTVFSSQDLSKQYPELKAGIVQFRSGSRLFDITIDAADGKKYSLSLDDLSLKTYESPASFDCMDGAIPESTGSATIGNTWFYFDTNNEDNQSFLVKRPKNKGTSQSRLYRYGDALLCPAFLSDPQRCEAYQHNKHLFILHASKWNDAAAKDLMTMIDENGDRKFTVPLSSLGKGQRKFFAKDKYLYTISSKEISVLDLESANILKRISLLDFGQ